MEEAAGGRVLLALPGAAVPVSLPPRPLPGELRVRLRPPQELVLEWEPLEGNWEIPEETEPPDPGFEPDWAVLSPPRPRPGRAGGFSLALRELRGLRRGPPALSPPTLELLPRGGPRPPPLHLPRGGIRKLRRILGSHLRPDPRDRRLLLVVTPEDPPEPPPGPGLVTRLLRGPCAATLGGLGRLLRGAGPEGAGPEGAGPEGAGPEPPFEVLGEVPLEPRPSPARGPPLAVADWGRGLDPEVLRERIFSGGVVPELRARAWPFLLGLRNLGDPGGTPESPEGTPDPARARRDDYFRMKLQWRSLSPGQLRRNKILRGYLERIDRDVAGDPSAPRLRELLRTFCMFHFDLGYVRGMKELLAPLAAVCADEAEAFWAFCAVMEMVGENFGPGPEGLRRNLGILGALLEQLNPDLVPLLAQRWPRRCCSRWLQFRFRRLLGQEGTERLWEVLWTGRPCPNFHLLVTCAALELLRDTLGDTFGDTLGDTLGDTFGDSDSDEDTDSEDSDGDQLSPLVAVPELLCRAEGLLRVAATRALPPDLRELLGLGRTGTNWEQLGQTGTDWEQLGEPQPPPEPPPDTA